LEIANGFFATFNVADQRVKFRNHLVLLKGAFLRGLQIFQGRHKASLNLTRFPVPTQLSVTKLQAKVGETILGSKNQSSRESFERGWRARERNVQQKGGAALATPPGNSFTLPLKGQGCRG
jgi:hypothetical protein